MDEKQISEIQELLVENKKLFSELKVLRDHLIQTILRLDEKVPLDRMTQFTDILKKPLVIDDKKTVQAIEGFKDEVQKLQNLDIGRIANELKFVGKSIHMINERLDLIEKEGLPYRLDINVSMDGIKMIKKPANYDLIDETKDDDEDHCLNALLNLLDSREARIMVLRLGLSGEKNETYDQIGKKLFISGGRARNIYLRALRVWRHKDNRHLIKGIKDHMLREKIGLD